MFCVYLHITNDTKEVFYVGKGLKHRPYKLCGRNKFWHNVVRKHGFVVEIVKENITEEQAMLLEQELIRKYGRRNLGTGSLVNLTDGGEGVSGKIFSVGERKAISTRVKNYYKLPENVQKRKKIAKEVGNRPEVKETLRRKAILMNSSDSFRKMKAKNTKASWNDIDIRNKRTASIRAVRSTEESKNKTKIQKQKTYVGFVSPTGEIYRNVTNLSEFCKLYGITKNGMYSLASGKLKQHKGWRKL